jgi:hypothetical protein
VHHDLLAAVIKEPPMRLPRDWYFPAGRARLYRRIASFIINVVVAGAIIVGALLANGIGVGSLPLVARDERPTNGPRVHFRNCDAARAAGKAPLHRGEPGYELRLDADGDGIACEPLPRRLRSHPR